MAMSMEMAVSLRKSFESIDQRLITPAPRTFRTPISFVRCSATKAARPKRPRQEMKMARTVKTAARLPMRCSASNLAA